MNHSVVQEVRVSTGLHRGDWCDRLGIPTRVLPGQRVLPWSLVGAIVMYIESAKSLVECVFFPEELQDFNCAVSRNESG